MKTDDKSIHQAIIAREVIDLYRDSHDKLETAESLDVLCFAMARLTNSDKVDYPAIDWDDLASNFDGIATSKSGDDVKIQKVESDIVSVYNKALRVIEKNR